MNLGELDAFLSATLDFTLDGRHYSVPPIDWETYIGLVKVHAHAALVEAGQARAEDAPEDRPLYEMAPILLGPVFEQLQTAGVHPAKISVIVRAAYLWQIGHDEAAALLMSGKVPAPETTSPTTTGSTGTAAGSTTPTRGSTSGTRSRKASKPQNAKQPESTPV